MAITTRTDIFTKMGSGKGLVATWIGLIPSQGGTLQNAAAGFFNGNLSCNAIGTTYPTTLVGFPLPAGLPNELYTIGAASSASGGAGQYLAYFYEIGTVNLAATGDQFTHHAATFPMLRTQYGEASKPITLLPMIYITTATATTAPIMTLKTAAGGAGYVDPDGNNVVGVRTLTLPAAATLAQSSYFFRLEDGDSGIRDITQIDVGTAGSAGAATVYGVELLMPLGTPLAARMVQTDAAFGGLGLNNLKPAVATSGTATAILGYVTIRTGGNASTMHINLFSTLNT
jgi:hypothetical protein